MREKTDPKTLPDDALLLRLFEVLRRTRHDEADLIALLAEVDARKIYARQAAPSMFAWCTERLHLSEQEAYLRITVARASREHPMLLPMLRDGRLHLSGLARLVPCLTCENRDAVLKRAVGMSHRQIRELVAELQPRPDAPARIRKLPDRPARPPDTTSPQPGDRHQLWAPRVASPLNEPRQTEPTSRGDASEDDEDGQGLDLRPIAAEPSPATTSLPAAGTTSPVRRASVEPLAPARFKVQFTAGAELRDKLERLQALMRSTVPDGDLAKVIDVAVTRELERREARRFGKTRSPRKRLTQTDTKATSRHIPAAVRRFVERRDGGRCVYRDARGRRCTRCHDLEFHHREPYAFGGDHRPEGLALMCRAHNALLAEQDFGKEKMARFRRRSSRESKPVSTVESGGGRSGLQAEWLSTG